MAINVEIERTGSESSTSMLRRFSKKIQSSGIVQEVRGRRYHGRAHSKLTKKKQALKLLSRRAKYEMLFKLGKIVERTGKRGGKKGR